MWELEAFVLKAYRTICDPCAFSKKKDGILLCTKCTENVKDSSGKILPNKEGNFAYAT